MPPRWDRRTWKLGLLDEVANPDYTAETLGEDVLYAMCERLNKEDPERADFSLEDGDDTSGSALAGGLFDYMHLVNKDAKAFKKRRRA